MKDNLLEMAQAACREAIKSGAEFAEAHVGQGKSANVRLELSEVSSTEVRLSSSADIQAFYKGGFGAVSIDGIDEARFIDAARQAAEMARFAVPDKDFKSLPTPSSIKSIAGLFDPLIEKLGVAELAHMAIEAVSDAKRVAPDAICSGMISSRSGYSAVANSLGVAYCSRGSSISAWLEPIIRRGDDVGAFYDFDAARTLTEFDHRSIGANAAEAALRFLGAKKIKSGVMPIILGPIAASSFIDSLASYAGAESHQRGRSWLGGMVGKKIGSDNITISDNATIPGGLSSRACDTEGVPSRELVVFENGVLKNLLHNSYTAGKAGVQSTGHALGRSITTTNVNISLGKQSAKEIIADTPYGLYINMGRISPDSTTGDVSAMVDFGFVIENGCLAYPVSSTMVGIGGFDLLANVDAVSADARYEPGSAMPTLRIQGVKVAGGK